MTYRIPDREVPWQDVLPFTPTPILSQDARGYIKRCLKGNGAEPESATSILGRFFGDVSVQNYLINIGEMEGEK